MTIAPLISSCYNFGGTIDKTLYVMLEEVNMTADVMNKFCHACGHQIDTRAEICPQCGVRQPRIKVKGERNRVAAALFGILLGGLGIHKFYLGKVGMGILYLVFFWTCIPAVIGLIEGIIYLTMSDEEFMQKYG
jgi:TM2 domain-containing membrane protein YozV